MKVVLLNLPYKKRIVRRSVASYYAPNFLIPPLELMSLGSIVKEWKKESVWLIDAIAENRELPKVIKELKKIGPDLIVMILGFNSFPLDIIAINKIKKEYKNTTIAGFGYLPTQFPEETLKKSKLDIIIMNEPEHTFSEIYDHLKENKSLKKIRGIAYKENGKITVNLLRKRIQNLDKLPFPDHSLIKLNNYNESFLGRSIGCIISERGCPYKCIYCVKVYGDKLVSRSAENILSEIEHLVNINRVRNIRFMDDTFCLNRKRLKNICKGLIGRQLNIKWTCLTRLDLLDKDMLDLMKKSGCQRMYIGIESGSQRILDYYKKGITVNIIKEKVSLTKRIGIEVSGFFIVGAPIETDDDITRSIKLAKDLDLEYIIVTKLQYWPGTKLFLDQKKEINFTLFPGKELLYSVKNYKQIQ